MSHEIFCILVFSFRIFASLFYFITTVFRFSLQYFPLCSLCEIKRQLLSHLSNSQYPFSQSQIIQITNFTNFRISHFVISTNHDALFQTLPLRSLLRLLANGKCRYRRGQSRDCWRLRDPHEGRHLHRAAVQNYR